ncbi:hypothetical protein AAFC00_004117 [Neodothiora populina]|uniref:WW domain-containing protein n=1 Tax=Neodothiora populina TaxID=2781224 RepID=A0ABR3PIL2_9PEZI
MSSQIPAEAPPPYSAATSGAPSGDPSRASNSGGASSFLHPNRARNGIPPADRRSMEDEGRRLPPGWVRQYDGTNAHQFFVDTRADPPRSIWHHPYDDEQYLSTLTSEERERIQEEQRVPTPADLLAESSDEEDAAHHALPSKGKSSHTTSAAAAAAAAATAAGAGASSSSSSYGTTPQSDEQISGVHRLGRKMKDKVTSTTHQQREVERQKRAEEERQAYERHLVYRRAMQRAMQTGQPQLIGKDRQGKDVYIEPPGGMQGAYYTQNGRMINPYSQGPYTNPNARFITPAMPYQRPYGYGYGGGMGLPLIGGLAGGMMLGGLMF